MAESASNLSGFCWSLSRLYAIQRERINNSFDCRYVFDVTSARTLIHHRSDLCHFASDAILTELFSMQTSDELEIQLGLKW